jgi:ParB-like chromosome segregation protein Spo0J
MPAPWAADKVERRPLADLLPYARNSRTHDDAQVAAIAASIREWGWTMPVLVDETGMIIAGHGRVLAAHKLGLEEIPVMVATGWSEAQKRAYVIADNKLTLRGGWNDELLRVELADLKTDGFDLTLTGFEPGEIDTLFAPLEDIQPLADLAPPDDFDSYDETIETQHECPQCGYLFSGGKVVPLVQADDDADHADE